MSAVIEARSTCCADFYSKDWVKELLGDSLHPGGIELSRRLWQAAGVTADSQVLDVACGTGITAVTLAVETGASVRAIDLSAENLELGRKRAEANGVADRITWICGDALQIPVEDASADVVLCECAVSTFIDKPALIAELVRALRPGGRLALSDMALAAPLDEDLASVLAPWTCVSDAVAVEAYQQLVLDADLRVLAYVDETPALRGLITDLKRKILLAGLGGAVAGIAELGLELSDARDLLKRSAAVVDAGDVQYFRLVSSKGTPARTASQSPLHADCDPSTGCC